MAFLLLALGSFYASSLKRNTSEVSGFHPIRDDSLAHRFAPGLISEGLGPDKLLYRMSRSSEGYIHIAYFFVWPFERNDAPGMGAFLSRMFYTGGLSLQSILFGPGDVEVITLVLDQAADPEKYRVRSLHFETARNYDPSRFGVDHQPMDFHFAGPEKDHTQTSRESPGAAQDPGTVRGNEQSRASIHSPSPDELIFEVMSWNHMFRWIRDLDPEDRNSEILRLKPAYFSQEDWQYYRMFKPVESVLTRNRAHPEFSREIAEPITL